MLSPLRFDQYNCSIEQPTTHCKQLELMKQIIYIICCCLSYCGIRHQLQLNGIDCILSVAGDFPDIRYPTSPVHHLASVHASIIRTSTSRSQCKHSNPKLISLVTTRKINTHMHTHTHGVSHQPTPQQRLAPHQIPPIATNIYNICMNMCVHRLQRRASARMSVRHCTININWPLADAVAAAVVVVVARLCVVRPPLTCIGRRSRPLDRMRLAHRHTIVCVPICICPAPGSIISTSSALTSATLVHKHSMHNQ